MNEGKLPRIYMWRWPTLEDAAEDPSIIEFFRQFDDVISIIRKTSESKLNYEERE